MLVKLFSFLRIAYISALINAKHLIEPHSFRASVYHHPTEDALFHALSSSCSSASGVSVLWGAYESGKTTAVRNVALRLQNEGGRTVIIQQGYDFSYMQLSQQLLKRYMGAPHDTEEPLSKFLSKPTTLIIDHFDLLMTDPLRAGEAVEFLRGLFIESAESGRFNVLVVVTSWEQALELRKSGCKVLRDSSRRWTRAELTGLFETLPASVRARWPDEDELLTLSALSGTPGFLTFAASSEFACPRRAAALDREWRMGESALDGDPGGGDTGRFPDKNGVFHHGDL